MSKINKVIVKGVSYDIEDKNEVTRAKEAEEELLKRIQGTSEKSDSRFDPFKDLGSFSSADEFNAVLDTLTYNRDIVGYGYGFFRATLAYRNIEIKNTLLSSGENVVIQVLSGVVRVVGGVITATGEKHNVLYRKHTATDGWSAWSESGLSDEDKAKLDKAQLVENITWGEGNNLDNYIAEGVYSISGNRNSSDNMPILNMGVVSARLTVTRSYNGESLVIVQVLNLNNNAGGEGNIYIRSNQNGTWKPWGKLQTNVEVGQITPEGMSNLTDNGIYSGVCVDGATVETFVLIVINNYLAATQAGFGSYISQLKYAIDLNRGNTVKTRTSDAYGMWSEWSEIGGSTYELPEATQDTLGGVKLGNEAYTNYAPLVKLPSDGGVGIGIDVNYFTKINSNYFLSIRHNDSLTTDNGLSVRLGTTLGSSTENLRIVIPCVIGTGTSSDGSKWNGPSVGIPYNTEQFCLKYNGLNLMEGIGSATKVTWDSNSDISDYIAAGVYDITGTRESLYDYLPITNIGENDTIAARLIVTVTPEGATTYRHSIGQTLILSNAEGKETKVCTRNGNRTSTDGGVSYTITWSDWKCLQGMVESYINTDRVSITTTGVTLGTGTTDNVKAGLNGMTENGMYSGIYTDDYTLQAPTFVETFVLVVINDYAVSSQAGTPRRISQLKYATDTLTGQCTVKKRVGTGSDSIYWGDWEDVDTRELIEKKDVISSVDDSENPVQSKAIAAAIEEGEKRALRKLYIAAGAEYNDTGADKTKTAPWGETVTHKAGYYYLNGLGDITEEQMMDIYNESNHYALSENMQAHFAYTDMRTNICRNSVGWSTIVGSVADAVLMFYKSKIEIAVISNFKWTSDDKYCFQAGDVATMFDLCNNLKRIVGVVNVQSATGVKSMLSRCPELLSVKIIGLHNSIIIKDSPNIEVGCIVYMIQNAAPTTAITITLHPDAYSRLADDPDVVAALNEKNGYIDEEGNEIAGTLPEGASINLVSA